MLEEISEFFKTLKQKRSSFLERITFVRKAEVSQGTGEATEKFDYVYITKFCMANTTQSWKANEKPGVNICNSYHRGLISLA